jgi:UDP-glucuronate decarboxylase
MAEGDGRVVSNFIVQALHNRDITVHGSGTQTRSLCYVDDLIDGIIAMMDAVEDFRSPINLGNPIELEVTEIAELIIQLTGSRSRIVHLPLPIDDPRHRKPDISLAQRELAWMPRITLTEGLSRTIEYFDRQLLHGAEAVH